MKHLLSKHTRSLTLGIAFSSLAIVFAAQVSALRSTAHGIYVQANAVEVRPPAMPGTNLRSAAPNEVKKTRAQIRKEAREKAKAKREARRAARAQRSSSSK